MRLTALLITSVFLSVHATGIAQSVTISGKDIPLKEIIASIKQQTGYVVFGNSEILDSDKKFTLSVHDLPLKDFLDIMFKDQPFTYQINSRTITLVRKTPEVIPPSDQTAFTAGIPLAVQVRGYVRDSTGLALIGASVRVKGSAKGVITNQYGEFILDADVGATLIVTFVGYEARQVQIMEINPGGIEIILKHSNSKLDEVQVQAYGTTSRRISTGNIITVKSDVISRQNITNPLMALQGRIPNLVITPANGNPGAAVDLQLRGQNSIGSLANGARLKTTPLILVDGVPYENNIAGPAFSGQNLVSALRFIIPFDIEQIDVLTDADATSIYGSRGGNGVILITTKRGKPGATSIEAGVSGGAQLVTRRLKMMNTQEYLAMRREAYSNYNMPVPDHNTAVKNYSNYDLTVWDTTRDTDWQKVFFSNAAKNYGANAAISGGNDYIQYRVGLTYSRLGYAASNDFFNEMGATDFNISGNTADHKFRVSLTGTYNINNTFSGSDNFMRDALMLPPNAPSPFLPNGLLNWEPNPSTPGHEATWFNPFARLRHTTEIRTNAMTANIDISYALRSNLQLKVTGGYNDVIMRSLGLLPIAAQDPATQPKGSASRQSSLSRGWTIDPQLNYSCNISEGRMEVLVGGTLQQRQSLVENMNANGYTSDALIRSIGFATSYWGNNQSSQYNYAGVFGRLNYNWNNKYILNASARRDGSSRFGPGNQFGNFWSLAGAWVFSEEDFFKKNNNFFSFGKLRSSYGSSGNDGVGDYGFIELYQSMWELNYQGIRTLQSSGVVNPDYHWEDTRRLDVSLDLGFFKDKALLSICRWITRADEQLGGYNLSSTAGGTRITVNQNAKIQNMGWDFMLNLNDIGNGAVKWASVFNFGMRKNKLLALPEGTGFGVNPLVEVGDVFAEFAAVRTYKGVNPSTGLYQFLGSDGTVSSFNNSYDLQKKINTTPYTIGSDNTFTYKNISLNFFVQLTRKRGKNYVYDPIFRLPGVFLNGEGNQPAEVVNRWRKPGDNAPFQKYAPAFSTPPNDVMEMVRNSDLFYVDASFISLRNASLSYSLPRKMIQRTGLKRANVYIQGQNLLLLTNYKGLDPETENVGSIPQMLMLSAGIQLSI